MHPIYAVVCILLSFKWGCDYAACPYMLVPIDTVEEHCKSDSTTVTGQVRGCFHRMLKILRYHFNKLE